MNKAIAEYVSEPSSLSRDDNHVYDHSSRDHSAPGQKQLFRTEGRRPYSLSDTSGSASAFGVLAC